MHTSRGNGLVVLLVLAGAALSCRPKQRPIEVLSKTPSVNVEISGMSDYGKPEYTYELSGVGCAKAEGEARTGLGVVVFKEKSLRKGMAGCVITVGRTAILERVSFKRHSGVYWVSDEFSIGSTEEGGLSARAKMEKIYELAPDESGPPKRQFDLTFAVKLPEGVKSDEFVNTTGTLVCEPPVGEINMNSLSFGAGGETTYERTEIPLKHQGMVINCSKLSLLAKTDRNTEIEFELELGKNHSFAPKANQRVELGGGRPLELKQVGETSLPAADASLRVEVTGECPFSRPWLDLGGEGGQPECKKCPDDKPVYNSILKRCVDAR